MPTTSPSDLYHRFTGYDDLRVLLKGSDEDVLVGLENRPALIRIPGSQGGRSRLVSCLLHGNEDSGFRAVVGLLRDEPIYPFDLWVLIGNVRAATTDGWFAHRYLDDQEDFNRVWGRAAPTTRMRRSADAMLAEVTATGLEGAVDLHNNTGESPVYAVCPTGGSGSLKLALRCTDVVLLWGLQAYTLMEALQPVCPAVAIECGLPQRPAHTEVARTVLDRFLTDDPSAEREIGEIYGLHARVVVRPEVAFAFGGALTADLDLVLAPGLDGANFRSLGAGTELGEVEPGQAVPLQATNMHGLDVTEALLEVTASGAVALRQDVIPVMMTTTVQQARRDCLFYAARRGGGPNPAGLR